jgi:signal peptidase I, archaeal type
MKDNEQINTKKLVVNRIVNFFLIMILTISTIIVFFSLVILISAYRNPEHVPDFFGYKPLIVLSGSMEKEIYTGDLVVAKVVNIEELNKGDIVAFKNYEEDGTFFVTTHRIVDVITENAEKEFITKGDNNNVNDEKPVKLENVEGKYLFRISGLGTVAMLLKTGLGLAIFFISIIAIFLVIFIIKRWVYDKDISNDLKIKEAEIEELKRKLEKKNSGQE